MKRIVLLWLLIFVAGTYLTAQNTPPSDPSPLLNTPKDHAWEVGLHVGHFFSEGNIDFTPGYGGGLHVRRALDYIFSLRLDLMYGNAKGEDQGNVRSFSTDWFSGSLQAVVNLNNLKWEIAERKTALYALAGVGLNNFSAELSANGSRIGEVKSDQAAFGELGGGIAFRISKVVNIGLEHKAAVVFGKRSDWIDGVQTLLDNPDERTTFHDVLQYTSIRLNFNLGKTAETTEPLYWLNPLEEVMADVKRLKDTRVTMADTDGDGIIDMIDEEENTPEGAAVSAKGIALDSDKDGLRDFEDQEPYSPPGLEINEAGVAQRPDIMEEVNRLVAEKLKNYQPTTPTSEPIANFHNWYLPVITFALDSDRIPLGDYGTLAGIAEILNSNVNLKLVVIGHTDETGPEDYNNLLSYRRAEAVINHLTNNYEINRNRLVLQWKGEKESLLAGQHEVNRRVVFKVAKGEKDMPAPTKN